MTLTLLTQGGFFLLHEVSYGRPQVWPPKVGLLIIFHPNKPSLMTLKKTPVFQGNIKPCKKIWARLYITCMLLGTKNTHNELLLNELVFIYTNLTNTTKFCKLIFHL
jgi:hypothetical protein